MCIGIVKEGSSEGGGSEVSEASKVETAIDVKDVACAKGKTILRDRGYGLADIFRGAPASEGGEPLADETMVAVAYSGRHIRLDNPWADLEDGNAIRGQSLGEEWSEHAEAGLAQAVVAAIDRSGVSTDRGDGNDLGFPMIGMHSGLFDHPSGGKLGEEERAFEVYREESIEACFGGF